MNFGTFQGAGNGTTAGTISRYTQTPTITTSQTIPVPSGVKRIEALLVGGGGNGAQFQGGGGFGGAAVIGIPITGFPLAIVIGAGGGNPTSVTSAGTRYAEVGGGGNAASPGRSGGGGGGGSQSGGVGGNGGPPPIGNVLWSYVTNTAPSNSTSTFPQVPAGSGAGGIATVIGRQGSFGGGGGGGGENAVGGPGGGGGAFAGAGTGSGTGGIGGGGGGCNGGNTGAAGGSMASVSIWGYTGFAGASGSSSYGGGGGGGLLGAASTIDGGNGGGGGAGNNSGVSPAGVGGAGFAVIRFYF